MLVLVALIAVAVSVEASTRFTTPALIASVAFVFQSFSSSSDSIPYLNTAKVTPVPIIAVKTIQGFS